MVLLAHHLSVEAANGVALGFRVRDGEGRPRFVTAARVGGSLLSSDLTVSYERNALPAGAPKPGDGNVLKPLHGVNLGGHGWLGKGTWALTSTLLVGAAWATMAIFDGRERLPSQLRAASIDRQSWYAAVWEAYALSLVQSFLLVDLAKVLCLALTSEPLLARLGLHRRGGRWLARPIRRVHKLLDLFL